MSVIIIHKCWGFLPKGKLTFSELEVQGAKEKLGFLGCLLSKVFSGANQTLPAVASQLLLTLSKEEGWWWKLSHPVA